MTWVNETALGIIQSPCWRHGVWNMWGWRLVGMCVEYGGLCGRGLSLINDSCIDPLDPDIFLNMHLPMKLTSWKEKKDKINCLCSLKCMYRVGWVGYVQYAGAGCVLGCMGWDAGIIVGSHFGGFGNISSGVTTVLNWAFDLCSLRLEAKWPPFKQASSIFFIFFFGGGQARNVLSWVSSAINSNST